MLPDPRAGTILEVLEAPANSNLLKQIEILQARLRESQKREQALVQTTVRWRELFDTMAEAICVLDQDQRIVQCNAAMRELLNRPENEVIGRFCWELVHGTTEPLPDCPCRRVTVTAARHTTMLAMGERWMGVTVDPRLDSQGTPVGFFHIMSDISEIGKKESALKEAHQTLLTVLDSLDANIYAVDLENYAIIFMNRRMREIFKNPVVSLPCYRIIHQRKTPCDHCSNTQLFDLQGNPGEISAWEGMDADKARWYLHRNRTVRWVDGRYVRLHVATDISAVKLLELERIQNESRMRQTQKMEAIGTLAGGIAHDFNNILSAILGYADLALDDANRGIATPAYVDQIVRAGQRARDLVQQILTFSRQTESESKPIQVQPIVKEALKLLRASLPSTIDIGLKIETDAMIMADPVQVHQVIMNLCANAGHAMRANGGRLEVVLGEEALDSEATAVHPDIRPGRYLRLMVRDTGHGIAPVHMDKIFDPYFTTKDKGEGTGLGLSVVQGIVQGCRGTISVSSRPGEGTTFKILLPVISQAQTATAAIRQMVPQGDERILLVDDEMPLADLGKELLERLGYQVTIVYCGTEALALFERRPDDFDLLITDMTMPYMTGDQLAEKIMRIRPDLPVIICTGYSQKVTPELMERLNIRALIMKPLIRDDMAVTLRRVLDQDKTKGAG